MKNKKIILSFVAVSIIFSSIFISGCAENISPNVYDSQDVGSVNKVVEATVVSIRTVKIDKNTKMGGLIGAATGGVAGSFIGGGVRSNILGGIGGAVLGGLAGNAIEKGINKTTGIEYILKTNSGSLLTVTQTKDLSLSVGQKVLIVYGRQTKIIPDNR